MKKTKFWLLGLVLLALSVSATAVFAYFTAVTETLHLNVGADGTEATVVDVASPYELAVAAAGTLDNAEAEESGVADRTNLRLTASVVLDRDLLFASDASLDLNGYTLDFNGHTITIAHFYRTTAKFVDGVFEDSAATADRGARILSDGCTVTTASVAVGAIAQNFGYQAPSDFVSVKSLTAEELAAATNAFVAARLYPYYIGDIALPTHFGSYAIRFAWSAACATEGLVADNGNVDPDVYATLGGDADVTLTLRIGGAATGTYTYAVVVTPAGGLLARAREDFAAALAPYAHVGETGLARYLIGGTLTLPLGNGYLGVRYALSATLTTDENATSALTFGVGGELSVPANGDVSVAVSVTAAGAAVGGFTYELRAVVDSHTAIAAQIVDLYGAYVFRKIGDENPLLDAEKLWNMGVVDAAYSFVNNEYATVEDPDTVLRYYELDETKRVIRLLSAYGTNVNVYLRVRLTFAGETEAIGKDVRLICLTDSSGSGETPGEDTELDLYTFACAQLGAALSVGSYENFSVLNRYRGYTIRYFAEIADASGSEPSDSKIFSQTVGDGRVDFVYRTDEIPKTDTVVCFRFRFGESDAYYDKDYRFTVKGVLQPSDVPDAALRAAVLAAYDANSDGILTTEEAAVEKASFSFASACATFAGLEYLVGTEAFDLTAAAGVATTATDLLASLPMGVGVLRAGNRGLKSAAGLSRLTELRELDLADNAIAAFDADGLKKLVSLSLARNALSACPKLSVCAKLTTVDLSGNGIATFDALLDCAGLKIAYLYGNSVADFGYGSAGVYNDYTFALMTRAGVTVYREQGVAYAPSAAAEKAALVLQGIMLDLGGQTISLPLYLYASSATDYYRVTWYENDLDHAIAGTAGADSVDFTPASTTRLLIVRLELTVATEGVAETAAVLRTFAF